jgi:hypothetical protein
MSRLALIGFVGLISGLSLVWFMPIAWAAPSFTVAAFDSLRTFRSDEIPDGGGQSVLIEVARGESESFQVVVINQSTTALGGLTAALSGLPGQVEIYAAGSVLIDKPGRTTDATPGRYFDLLRPIGWESIPPGEYLPYWVDVHVPEDTDPGFYEGQVTVSVGGETASIPVSLRVWDFCLPKRPSLKLAFAFQQNWMEDYYGYQLSQAQIEAAQDVMLAHRLGPLPMWGSAGDELYQPARLKQCIEQGMNVFLLPVGGSVLAPREQMLRSAGVAADTYLFGYDEITMSRPDQIPAMRQAYEAFQARYPDIRRINTSQPDSRLIDFVDIFVVPVRHFAPAMAQERETWWYSTGSDRLGEEPDFRIDFPSLVQRGFFLAAWKAGVSGQLYWAVQREWPANRLIENRSRPEDEWRAGYNNVNTGAWVQDNGGGNLFYPDGQGSMLPSVRVKRMRDGIEDHEYLAQLKAAQAALGRERPSGWQELERQARELLNVPDTLITISSDWGEHGWEVVGEASMCTRTTHPAAIHDGKQALRVLPQVEEISVYQDVSASAGQSYTVSGWIKTDDLSGSARLRAEVLDSAGKLLHTAESGTVSGSSRRFIQCTITLPGAPVGSHTLRVSLVAVAANESRDPLQKAFFDAISVTENGEPVALVNPGFENQRVWLTDDTQAYSAYRRAVAECLEQCARALGRKGPFTDDEASVPSRPWLVDSHNDEAAALATLARVTDLLAQRAEGGNVWPKEEFYYLARYMHEHEPAGGPVTEQVRLMAKEDSPCPLRAFAEVLEQIGDGGPSLAQASSFEDASETAHFWQKWIASTGSIQCVEGFSYTGRASLLIEGMEQGGPHQTLDVQPGLIAVAARYYTPPGSEEGAIHLTLHLQDAQGTILASQSSRTNRLPSSAGTWSSLALLEDIPAAVAGRKVAKAQVVVAINDAPNTSVYVDDVVVCYSKAAVPAAVYEQLIDFASVRTTRYGTATITGMLDAQVTLPLAEEEDIKDVEILLNDLPIYKGVRLPTAGEVVVDTRTLADGRHRLTASIVTTKMGRLTTTRDFATHNSWTLLDSFRPPAEGGWLGFIDYSETSEESTGWQYSTEREGEFWGDTDRKLRTGNTTEYLIWETPLLREFALTVYAKKSEITEIIDISISSDGVTWDVVPYTIEDAGPSVHGWHKLQLRGEPAGKTDAALFRLTVRETSVYEEVHLGEAEFQGWR